MSLCDMQYKKKTIKIIGNITYFSLNFKVKVEKKCQKPKSERLQGLQSEYKLCLPISSMTKSGLHQFLKQNHSQSTSSQKQNWLTLEPVTTSEAKTVKKDQYGAMFLWK